MKAVMWLRLGVVLALAGLLAGCSGQGGAQNVEAFQDRLAQLDEQVSQLVSRVDTLQQQVASSTELAQTVDELQVQVEALQNGSAGTGGAAPLRIGFVNAEEVFVKFQGTQSAIQRYSEEKKAKEEELQNLRDQWSAGTISQKEYEDRLAKLQAELQALDQELTADITQKILDTIQELGKELDYDLITGRKNVILYYKEGRNIVDLTEQVLERMNEKYGQTSPEGGS